MGPGAVLFKLTETKSKNTINWKVIIKLTETKTETEKFSKLKLKLNWKVQNYNWN